MVLARSRRMVASALELTRRLLRRLDRKLDFPSHDPSGFVMFVVTVIFAIALVVLLLTGNIK